MKFLTSMLITLPMILSSIQAAPQPQRAGTGSPTVERRARISAGPNDSTCYYQCPANTNDVDYGNTAYSRTDTVGDDSRCFYQPDAYCAYNTMTGAFTGDNGLVTDCPAQAPDGGCGTQPDRGFKKRADYSQFLGRARDDKAIIDRQFKYTRPARPARPNRPSKSDEELVKADVESSNDPKF